MHSTSSLSYMHHMACTYHLLLNIWQERAYGHVRGYGRYQRVLP